MVKDIKNVSETDGLQINNMESAAAWRLKKAYIEGSQMDKNRADEDNVDPIKD